MASAQVYDVSNKTHLENCSQVRNGCLCLHGPPVILFIDTNQRPFIPPHLSLFRKRKTWQNPVSTSSTTKYFYCEEKNN